MTLKSKHRVKTIKEIKHGLYIRVVLPNNTNTKYIEVVKVKGGSKMDRKLYNFRKVSVDIYNSQLGTYYYVDDLLGRTNIPGGLFKFSHKILYEINRLSVQELREILQ